VDVVAAGRSQSTALDALIRYGEIGGRKAAAGHSVLARWLHAVAGASREISPAC
jgi:hypothetical protein